MKPINKRQKVGTRPEWIPRTVSSEE